MTDWITFPQAQVAAVTPEQERRNGAVARWLWIVAAMVFLMVVVGGITRMTYSGLSITEWKPITGALPPLSESAWLAEFEKYKQIPQYSALFPLMDLAGFKYIYFWEWSHRLLGRLIGLVFALPLLFFWIKGYLTPRLLSALLGVLALGGLQGFAGWWMVASGLVNRTEVAQERLAIHLLLASITFSALVWLATGLRANARSEGNYPALRSLGTMLVLLVLVQTGLGGLVAGLRAGLTYNTWPLMDGAFIPPADHLMSMMPWWHNLLDNVTTVQFQHRMTAYALVLLTIINAVAALHTPAARRARALVFLALVQTVLGIVTLLLVVPLWAGLLHQAFAMAVLAMAVVNRRLLALPAGQI